MNNDVPWAVAAAICVFVLPIPIALALEVIGRSLSQAGLAVQVVATIGLTLVVQSVIDLYYGFETSRSVEPFIPNAFETVKVGDAFITYEQITFFCVAAGATALLYMFFRLSRLGVAMRGIVDDPGLLDLAGTNPVSVRRAGWLIGVSFASLSGVMLTTNYATLNSLTITFTVISAFGAAAIGGFSSLPMTFAGGLLIGVLQSLAQREFLTDPFLSKLPTAIPLLVLFVVLLVFPKRYLVERSRFTSRDAAGWTAPWQLQAVAGLGLVVFLAFVPEFAGARLGVWTLALASVIIFLSLGLLTRMSGQVSLCHVAFAAIGTAGLGHLVGQGVPWGLALLAAGLIAVPVGAFLAIPAMRLTGLYLALATFGFGFVLQDMFYTQDYMFGPTGILVTRPPGFSGGEEYYYFVLAFVVVIALFVVALGRSRLGRLLRGMAGSPTALTTSGTSLNVTRMLVFCLSAFLAAIGGALASVALTDERLVSTTAFPTFNSLVFLVVVIISLGREPWYAFMAAALFYLIPSYIEDDKTGLWLNLLFGLVALTYAMVPASAFEVPLPIRNAIDRLFRPKAKVADATLSDAAKPGPALEKGAAPDKPAEPVIPSQAVPSAGDRVAEGSLEVDEIVVAFGGNVAVNGFSLTAPTGQITGLIGPNGAGKTTTFNACSGIVTPRSGSVRIDGHTVNRSGPAGRARRGLGRTFQRMELVDSLSVRDNIAIGYEGSRAAWNPFGHLLALPSQKKAMMSATDSALRLCDLHEVADRPVGALSTGQRRLVELARCLAGPFRLLLLDEPSSGLDKVETERFAEILRRVVAERGVGTCSSSTTWPS